MSFQIIDYVPEHLLQLNIQPGQREMHAEITPEYAQSLTVGPAFTAIDGDFIIGCGGLVEQWRGRWMLWSVLSVRAKDYMVRLTFAARRTIAMQGVGRRRLEAIVRTEFVEGHRWAKLLGLSFHHHEERFLPNGEDADIYVRFS